MNDPVFSNSVNYLSDCRKMKSKEIYQEHKDKDIKAWYREQVKIIIYEEEGQLISKVYIPKKLGDLIKKYKGQPTELDDGTIMLIIQSVKVE